MSHGKAGSRLDWRARPGGTTATPSSRWIKRTLMTFLAVALLAWFVYLLWPRSYPVTRFALLSITEHDAILPTAPASLADVAGLKRAWPADYSSEWLEGSDTSEAIRQVGARFGDRPGDVLILYATALGISDDGAAYLLCSDYLPVAGDARAAARRYRLSDLLAQLAAKDRPAKLKLLILDAPYLTSDPRLGVVVNEFSRLVEQEVRATDDPRLWCLLAGRPFEKTHVSPATRRSVFARFIEEGLRGEADAPPGGNDDRVIDLDELYRYVRDRIALWTEKQCQWPDGQYPLLFWGGGPSPTRDDEIPKRLSLAVLLPPSAAVPAEEAKPAADDSEAAKAK
ncbi:MAG: hypothetical protein NUV77_20435, partial [Thermoguttaceae bacterium]|nr:hypothetical protein [Thermoguttaceae bacterium]